MKTARALIAFSALGLVSPAFAQTNTFPASGNVGVGTTAPVTKLEVKGTTGSSGSGADIYANGENSVISIDSAVSRLGFVKKYGNYPVVAAGSGAPLQLGHWSTASLVGNITSGTFFPELVIGSTGNIGIGTTNPATKLHIHGGQLRLDGTSYARVEHAVSGQLKWSVGLRTSDDYYFYREGGSGNVLFSSGNVGVGTTSPTHKLSVNGTIKAKEVIVETTGWSDYVFADDYRLAPLSEVEAHIKAERRLPGIPSEQQVAGQGVSIGEMQALLLAKIEELTLHQIRQEKRLNDLQAQNERLVAENEALRRN